MGDEYEYGVVQGSLKLKKGRVTKPSKSKSKKSKKSKSSTAQETPEEPTRQIKTEAELKHEQMLQKRKLEQIERQAQKSYRDRVKEFNEKLENTPEQHDMPRVGG